MIKFTTNFTSWLELVCWARFGVIAANWAQEISYEKYEHSKCIVVYANLMSISLDVIFALINGRISM